MRLVRRIEEEEEVSGGIGIGSNDVRGEATEGFGFAVRSASSLMVARGSFDIDLPSSIASVLLSSLEVTFPKYRGEPIRSVSSGSILLLFVIGD